MDSKQFMSAIMRDAILIDALHRALFAMQLTSGCAIAIDGVHVEGKLNFEHQIRQLKTALQLLGIDSTETLPDPTAVRRQP